jgi:hypothetical protein
MKKKFFDKTFSFFRIIFFVILFVIIGSFVFKSAMIYRSFNGGKKLYQVDVNSFNNVETYLTDSYVVDPNTKCLIFKDELGIKRTICNNYTITEY